MTRLVWDVAALVAGMDGGTRPQALWDAALATLAAHPGPGGTTGTTGTTEVAVLDAPTGAVLWDAETLGAPLALDPTGDVGSLLVRVAAVDPRTWAGLLEGRYAAGSLGSYLVARATRGLDHVGLDRSVPDPASVPAGLPADEVLPEVVPPGPVSTTDPACCAGLAVPLLLLPA